MKELPYFSEALAYVMKKHRDRLKLPQRKIAETLDADITTVRNFEYGIQIPSTTTIFLLAKALGFEPDAFVKEIDDQIIYLTDKNSSKK